MDSTSTTDVINFGARGSFDNNQSFSGDSTDVILGAAVDVTIPTGTYTIAFGSDDGGFLRFSDGVTFSSTTNENGHTYQGTNEIRYNRKRVLEQP